MENIFSNHMLQNKNVAQDKAAWQQYIVTIHCIAGMPNNSHTYMLSWFVPLYQFIVLVFSDDKIPIHSSTCSDVHLPRKFIFPQKKEITCVKG
jgi:hypothetical protein